MSDLGLSDNPSSLDMNYCRQALPMKRFMVEIMTFWVITVVRPVKSRKCLRSSTQ